MRTIDHHVRCLLDRSLRSDSRSAAEALAACGLEALPELLEALEEENFRSIPKALSAIGPAAIPGLREALRWGPSAIRDGAVRAIGRIAAKYPDTASELLSDLIEAIGRGMDLSEELIEIGPAAAAAVPALMDSLRGRDPEDSQHRRAITYTVSSLGFDVIPALLAALRDESPAVRACAAATFGEFPFRGLDMKSPALKASLPDLVGGLKDECAAVRRACFVAIDQIEWESLEESLSFRDVLADEDPEMRAFAAGMLYSIRDPEEHLAAVLRMLDDPDPTVRAKIAREIGMGHVRADWGQEGAEAAARALLPLLGDESEDLRSGAALALKRVRAAPQESIPALLSALSDCSDLVAEWAREALEGFGPAARETARPIVERLLDDPDPARRRKAVRMLRDVAPSERWSPALAFRGLQDTDHHVRLEAVLVLHRRRPVTERSLQELTSMLEDASPEVRLFAVRTLASIGGASRPVADALRRAVCDPDAKVRAAALEAIREAPKEVSIPSFVALLQHEDPGVRNRAEDALRRAGQDAVDAAIAALETEVASGRHRTAARALAAISRPSRGPYASRWEDGVRPTAEPQAEAPSVAATPRSERQVLLDLIAQLAGGQAGEAVRALGRIGPPAAEARPAIVSSLGRRLGDAGWGDTVRALTLIGLDAETRGLLLAAIREEFATPLDHQEQESSFLDVAEALVVLGEEAVAVLAEVLRSPVPAVRWRTARGLGAIARCAGAALPCLLAALKDTSRAVREEVAATIGRVGWAASAAVPDLIEALADQDSFVRREAARALGRIGPGARDAAADLRNALGDAEDWVREQAARALRKIEGWRVSPDRIDPEPEDAGGLGETAWLRRIQQMERRLECLRRRDPDVFGHHTDEAFALDFKIGRERKAFQSRVTSAIAQGAELRFRKAAGLRADVLRDGARAQALLRRHNGLVRSPAIVQVVLELERTGDARPLSRVRRLVKGKGAFLNLYDLPLVEARLPPSPCWVVAEAEGVPPSGTDSRPMPVTAADCQCYLSEDRPDATLHSEYVRLPDPRRGDYFFQGREIADEIRADPACAGCVADVCAEDRVANLGFAGVARHEAFSEILRRNEARTRPVRFLLAEIFSIRGVKLPGGTSVLLRDLGQPPLGNEASMTIHAHSVQHPAIFGWMLVERNVRGVRLSGDSSGEYELITDWFVMVHDLRFSPAGRAPEEGRGARERR